MANTTAQVFMGTDDVFTASSSGLRLYGGTGNDNVTLGSGANTVTLDQSVDRLILPGLSSSYRFKQGGNQISIFDSTGAITIVTVPVQTDADGTIISFSDGQASAMLQAGGIMKIGGATVSSSTPTAATPTLTANPVTTSTPTKSKVFLGPDDTFTASDSGITIYGNTGNTTVTVDSGVSGVILDQSVGTVVFANGSSNYTFKQTGNQINVYDSTGTQLLMTTPVQSDADGTVLKFGGNETHSALLQTGGVLKLGTGVIDAVSPKPVSLSANTIAVAAAGSSSAANGNFVYNVAMGNYTYTINSFGAGDKVNGPAGVSPSVINSSFTDGTVNLQYAANQQLVVITIAGITNAQDAQLFAAADFNTTFGTGTLGTVGGTTSVSTTGVTVNAAGNSSAANADVTFNVVLGNYTYTVAGFGPGDKVVGPSGVAPSVLNSSFTDGSVILQYAANQKQTVIVLTGITNAQDGLLFSVSDFNTVFGAGTVS